MSDLHLGSGKTASSHLYEFLTHLNTDTLKDIYLIGDVVGGTEQAGLKQRPFHEMERRILDVLNYLAAQGIKIHYIPGNHDERLRGIVDSKGQDVDILGRLNASAQRNVARKAFSENVVFELYTDIKVGDKKFLIEHSDLRDPHWPNWLEGAFSELYDRIIWFDAKLNRFAHRNFHIDIPLAKSTKQSFKRLIDMAVSRKKTIAQVLEQHGYDGTVIGHTHTPGITTVAHNGKSYTIVNDGDWQEGGSAAFIEPGGTDIKVLDYRNDRGKYFAALPLPTEASHHPQKYAAHRGQTNRQVRMIRRMWPVKRKSTLTQIAKYRHAGQKLREHMRDIEGLDAAIGHLHRKADDRIESIRTAIADTAAKKDRFLSRTGEIGAIFERAVRNEGISDADRKTLLDIAHDLRDKAVQKLGKHFEARVHAARNLNHVREPQDPRLTLTRADAPLVLAA